jgi:hypothetical protein
VFSQMIFPVLLPRYSRSISHDNGGVVINVQPPQFKLNCKWVTGFLDFFRLPVLAEWKHDVSETGSVSVFRRRGEKAPTRLGPLEGANLYRLKMGTDPVFETSCFYSAKHRTMKKVEDT